MIKKFLKLVILICSLLFVPAVFAGIDILEVKVQGLDLEQQKAVLATLSIAQAQWEDKLPTARIHLLHELAPQEIQKTLESYGYYQAQVQSRLQPLKNGWQAEYTVNKGPVTLVKKLSIVVEGPGKDSELVQAWLKKPPLRIDKPLEHPRYEEAKQSLLGKTLEEGYLEAVYTTSEIIVNRDNNTAVINLVLATWPRYRIGELRFTGSKYSSHFLKKYLPFAEGDDYSTAQLLALQKNLLESELFAHVQVDPLINQETNQHIPLEVHLTPKLKNRYTAALGYGTDSGFRGQFGYERRLAFRPGHRLQLGMNTSGIRNEAHIRYLIPGKRPTLDNISFGFKTSEEHVDHKYLRNHEWSATSRQKRGHLERLIGLKTLNEIYKEGEGLPKERAHFLLPNGGIIWSDSKGENFQQQGSRLGVNVKAAHKLVYGSASFLQTELQAKHILFLNQAESLRFILKAQAGTTRIKDPEQKFHRIPLSLRYYAGGDVSVRGFSYHSLGPTVTDLDGNINAVGGRQIFTASAELEKKLFKQLSAAAFVDCGNVFNEWKGPLAVGAGLGIRISTPLGQLRVDVAQPLKLGNKKPRLHLTFGKDL